MADRQGEDAFLAAYDPRAFEPIAVTVDVVALTLRQGALHVLLVRRGGPPYEGAWALPGGFVQAGRESLDEAAARELAEETGLDAARGLGRVHLEQLGSYGRPDRDPRMHVVSVAYLAFAPDLPEAQAGSDAAAAEWVPVEALAPQGNPDAATERPKEQDRPAGIHGGGSGRRSGRASVLGTVHDAGRDTGDGTGDGTGEDTGLVARLAFDHGTILAEGLDRARAKIEYTPLATAFLGEEFTVTELRSVYEAVWGRALHAGNFHRKVLSVPGFVESTGATAGRGGAKGGPRARLYRAGDARLLHPALLRPDREDSVR